MFPKMKTFRCSFLFSLLVFLGLASLAQAASAPAVEVTISNSAGKVVYKGKTDSGGAFATPSLAAGDYVVLFNSKGSVKGGPYALVVNVGEKKVDADSVPAAKFSHGGVAMKVPVDHPMKLTGEIAAAGATKTVAANTQGKSKSKGKTKYVNGREYVWIPPEPGGWLPGKWVEAGSVEARNAEGNKQGKVAPEGSTTQPDR